MSTPEDRAWHRLLLFYWLVVLLFAIVLVKLVWFLWRTW